jgi:hypothetical protein
MDGYSGYNQAKMVEEDNEKQHSLQNGVHMHIMLCLLGHVMPLLPFKK